MNIVYLNCSKVFDTAFHEFHIDKLLLLWAKYMDSDVDWKLDKWLGPEGGDQLHKV